VRAKIIPRNPREKQLKPFVISPSLQTVTVNPQSPNIPSSIVKRAIPTAGSEPLISMTTCQVS
jgi:hypothetical protein